MMIKLRVLLLEILTFISANVHFIKVNIDLVEFKTIYCKWEVNIIKKMQHDRIYLYVYMHYKEYLLTTPIY